MSPIEAVQQAHQNYLICSDNRKIARKHLARTINEARQQGYTFPELATELKMTPSAVSNIVTRGK